ncbi:hypothetical protein NOK64_26180 [Vibrio parahaemolyticus]|nr:hypothetical protein [Vibrio parahaemolyticus]
MAVLVQSLAFVIMAQWFASGGGVVHPLTRRYVLLRKIDMEVIEASPDLAPILASYAKECLKSGIPKYSGVQQDPEAYLSGLVERSKAN